MTAIHETLPEFSGTLPEAPDDLRALEEQMPDVMNVSGTIPYQEASMSGELPFQGNLETENFRGTLDLAGLAPESSAPDAAESASTQSGEAERKKDQMISGITAQIMGLSVETPPSEASTHTEDEHHIASVNGTIEGAEDLYPGERSFKGVLQAPETSAGEEATVLALDASGSQNTHSTPEAIPNVSSDDENSGGTLPTPPPKPPVQQSSSPRPPQAQPTPPPKTPASPRPTAPRPEMLTIPAEPARHGLSAAKLNELLDSDDPADRARALAETRRQNQNDGTRIMPENLKDFTPADVNFMSEQQIHSITPKLAKQMSRQARESVRDWQKYYHEKRNEIANATPERFAWIKENISRLYSPMTEGAKGAYQIRLIGEATPNDLARINPNQLTVPDARKLYDERRRILEEQGYRF